MGLLGWECQTHGRYILVRFQWDGHSNGQDETALDQNRQQMLEVAHVDLFYRAAVLEISPQRII